MSDEGPGTRPTDHPISPAPDTEQMSPLTPDSQHISVEMASSPITRVSGTDLNGAAAAAAAKKRLASTDRSRFSALESTPSALPQSDSNTTLQSMARPDVNSDGVPNARRFLSIERELDETSASLKLVQKRASDLERSIKFAWITAGLALIVALSALIR